VRVPLLPPDQHQLVEAIAHRVVELLDQRDRPAAALVDATTLARLLGVSRATVYEHASELGAIEVGAGDRPRLRFDVETAHAAWTRRVSSERSHEPESPAPIAVARRRRTKRAGSESGLLPVRGREAA
jgi:hypothetical protein